MIRVLLADDHSIVRAGLARIIEESGDIQVGAEASDGREAIKKATEMALDVAVVDISMPGLDGLEVITQLQTLNPKLPVLVLTMHADDEYLRQCLKGGAAGYVLKQAADQELLLAIRAVMRGEVYIHPAMTRGLLGDLIDRSRDVTEPALSLPKGLQRTIRPEDALSDRETEVIRQVARGHTNQEIAETLCVSKKTVESHRANIMRKLDLHDVTELVKYALRKGLIPLD